MREKNEFVKASIIKRVYDRIKKDKKHFQETISGKTWSVSDTIEEYQKIIDGLPKNINITNI